MLAAGLLCGVAGLVVVSTLRRTLLTEEIGPRIFSDAPQVGGHLIALTLMDNLSDIASAFTTYSSQMFVVVPMFLLGVVAIALLLAYRWPDRLAGLAFVYVAMVAALFTFGKIYETRIYVELIPLLVAGAVTLASRNHFSESSPGSDSMASRQAPIEPSAPRRNTTAAKRQSVSARLACEWNRRRRFQTVGSSP